MMAGQKTPAQPLLILPRSVIARQSTAVLAVENSDVATALHFIRQRRGIGITPVHVMAQVGVSRRSLEQHFRNVLHRGIAEEIRRVRLERVQELLRDSDLPVKAIASRTGFSSVTRLATDFQHAHHQTPRAYRAQFRTAHLD